MSKQLQAPVPLVHLTAMLQHVERLSWIRRLWACQGPENVHTFSEATESGAKGPAICRSPQCLYIALHHVFHRSSV